MHAHRRRLPKTHFEWHQGADASVEGCNKQDYAVLIVIGVGADNANSTK
jgi:hypothetical protein